MVEAIVVRLVVVMASLVLLVAGHVFRVVECVNVYRWRVSNVCQSAGRGRY